MNLSSFDKYLRSTKIIINKQDCTFGDCDYYEEKEITKIYRFENNYGALINTGYSGNDINIVPDDLHWRLEIIKFTKEDINLLEYVTHPIPKIWNFTFEKEKKGEIYYDASEWITEQYICVILYKVKKYGENIDNCITEYTRYEKELIEKANHKSISTHGDLIYNIIIHGDDNEEFWFLNHKTIEELIKFYNYYTSHVSKYEDIININDSQVKGAFYKTIYQNYLLYEMYT